MRKIIVALVTVLVLLGALGIGGVFVWREIQKRYTPQVCTVQLADETTTTLTSEQARNASIIVAVAMERDLPERAAIVALATAYQESALRNIDYGDRDSLGLFQQRPSQGWGTAEEIMDPWYSAGKFYDGLVKVDGWESMAVTVAAQKVQISAYPDAYAKHEANATGVARALLGADRETLWCVNFESDPSPNLEYVSPVLNAQPGVSAGDLVDNTMTLTADDETALWAAANHVIANSYGAGVTEVTVGQRRWRSDEQGWSNAKTPAADLTAVVTFG